MTDEERREVAARLRELPIDMYEVEERWEAEGLGTDCHDQTDYFLIHNVLFGCLPAEHMHPCDYEELHARLADLIEPEERTCRMVLDEDATSLLEYDEVFRCTACGEEVVRKTGTTIRFCPMCRARVTDWVVPG